MAIPFNDVGKQMIAESARGLGALVDIKCQREKSFRDTKIYLTSNYPDEFASDKWDTRFLDLAKLVSTWSKDPSTGVGAVIVDGGKRVVSLGYNGPPRGIEDSDERLQNRDTKYKLAIHAEENAILFANQSLCGCTLYTWPLLPCSRCAAKVIQVGIGRVVSVENNGGVADRSSVELSKQLFDEAGVLVDII